MTVPSEYLLLLQLWFQGSTCPHAFFFMACCSSHQSSTTHLKDKKCGTRTGKICMTYLFPELYSWKRDNGGEHSVGDKALVIHQLVAGEGGHRVQKVCGCSFEVPHCQSIHALVNLQPVSTVPVTALLDKAAANPTKPVSVDRSTLIQLPRVADR